MLMTPFNKRGLLAAMLEWGKKEAKMAVMNIKRAAVKGVVSNGYGILEKLLHLKD